MKLNGKEIYNKKIKTLKDLIDLYKINIKNTAILVNGEIVRKEELDEFKLNDDDNVEIVGFVGGG